MVSQGRGPGGVAVFAVCSLVFVAALEERVSDVLGALECASMSQFYTATFDYWDILSEIST